MEAAKTELSKVRLAQSDIHEQWENDYLSPDLDKFYDMAFDEIIRNMTGNTVLDIGCGYCFHTKRLARSSLTITAVDFSPAALARAEKTIEQAGIKDRVTLRQEDATKLSFPSETFDNVLIWGVLMHIPEVEKALSEAARVLKPGGRLVLCENNCRSLEVQILERGINIAKRLLGRKPHPRNRVPLGIEEWQSAGTGGLMVRKTDMPAMISYVQSLGLKLHKRIAGQLTELYARVPGRRLKSLIHAFNRAYFRAVGRPGPALGNLLIFTKL